MVSPVCAGLYPEPAACDSARVRRRVRAKQPSYETCGGEGSGIASVECRSSVLSSLPEAPRPHANVGAGCAHASVAKKQMSHAYGVEGSGNSGVELVSSVLSPLPEAPRPYPSVARNAGAVAGTGAVGGTGAANIEEEVLVSPVCAGPGPELAALDDARSSGALGVESGNECESSSVSVLSSLPDAMPEGAEPDAEAQLRGDEHEAFVASWPVASDVDLARLGYLTF